jgi:hypothetical protein
LGEEIARAPVREGEVTAGYERKRERRPRPLARAASLPTVAEDWRLQVQLADPDHGVHLLERLRALKLKRDAVARLGDRLVVSQDGPELFLYADSQAAGREAERLVHSLLEEHRWEGDVGLYRWHPIEESWQEASRPLPRTDEERRGEHRALMEREEAETRQRGYPEWEVRIQLPSHRDAAELSARLDEEGLPHVRRWRYILIGANDEDEAQELAERMRREAPKGSEASVEGTFAIVEAEAPWNPFAIFGGLAG